MGMVGKVLGPRCRALHSSWTHHSVPASDALTWPADPATLVEPRAKHASSFPANVCLSSLPPRPFRSILVRQARFDAGVVLAVLGLDPATRRMVQPYADRLAVGVACGKVAVTQPLSALLALLTMTHRRVRGAKLHE